MTIKDKFNRVTFAVLLISLVIVVFELGVNKSAPITEGLNSFYHLAFLFSLVSIVWRYFPAETRPKTSDIWVSDAFFVGLTFYNVLRFVLDHDGTHESHFSVYTGLFLLFLREMSTLNIIFSRKFLTPSQLFILSFIGLILGGTGLLMLPKSTVSGSIPFIDALFTSTSAVCVTGLAVVDTGAYFTHFGQSILTLLIQLGGIGIMTFTAYFSYFFRGGSSFENQLVLKDMVSIDKLGEVFGVLNKIILLTLGIETVGALFIFFSVDESMFSSMSDRAFFAVFHAVSSFCNAGFSTLSNSFYEESVRFNYSLHLIIIVLFVAGGIGFPIMFNFIKYIKIQYLYKFLPWRQNRKTVHFAHIINLNTRISLSTTAILIFFGTIIFYLFEQDNTLAEHHGFGKIVAALFGATTPRTAGFNSIDTGALHSYTIMIVLFLMWVGASPGSTGGGIKTSTLALATLNFLSIVRGKERVEIYRREIPNESIRRAFATISLSLIAVGASTFFLVSFEPDKDLMHIAFETFSAFSTAGLSMGITASLTTASKFVLVFTMFVGRVSILTLLGSLLSQVKNKNYRYPSESVQIN